MAGADAFAFVDRAPLVDFAPRLELLAERVDRVPAADEPELERLA